MHISTSRAQCHRANSKIPTAMPNAHVFTVKIFNGTNSSRPIVWRRLDIRQKSKMAVAKMKGNIALAQLLSISSFLSRHVMPCHGHHLAFDRNGNSAIRFSDPENPTLEPNMKWIGSPVAEIWPFKIWHITKSAFTTLNFGGRRSRKGHRSYHRNSDGSFLYALQCDNCAISDHSTQFVIECLRHSNQQGKGGPLWIKILGCSLWNRSVWCCGLQRANTPAKLIVTLLSNNFTVCDHDTSTSRTDGPRTDRQLAVAIGEIAHKRSRVIIRCDTIR